MSDVFSQTPRPDEAPRHCWHVTAERLYTSYLEQDKVCCWCGAGMILRCPVGGRYVIHGPHTPADMAVVGHAPEPEEVYPASVDRHVCRERVPAGANPD